uniref:Palmitoyltransferase n=1 Tax=Panagrellus redivivus TaxID=6233 RepID=A0A7E4UPH8_PANRE
MSWYSKIYVFVREYRKRHPFTGIILHLMLNAMLCLQICGIVYGYYCYVFLTCFYWLQSGIQIAIYLVIYHSLCFMAIWSLFMTIVTPISRVPAEYHADNDTDAKLKACTPVTGERYFPDQSDANQVEEQNKILNTFAMERGLTFVEVDHFNRLRYCYQCNLLKPDRAHHCSSCGFCVVKFDHHCPWINKCVSVRNYKFFLLYIFYGTMWVAFDLLSSLEVIIRFALSDHKNTWKRFVPVLGALFMHVAFTYYPLGELLHYHAKLVWDNETTCEQAKPPLIRGESRANYNITPYRNYRSVFGWGLWAFPVPTPVIDGLHYHVRYPDDYNGERYEVVCRGHGSGESDNNNSKSKSKSKSKTDVPAGGDAQPPTPTPLTTPIMTQ